MKATVLHGISALLKLVSLGLIIAPALGADVSTAGIGAIIFVVMSCLKDLLLSLGDWIDNGKKDGSFKGPPYALLAAGGFALCGAVSMTACESLGPVAQITVKYEAAKYLKKAKTPAAWEKRHTKLDKITTEVATLNEQGLSMEALQALAAPYIKDDADIQFVVDLVSLYAPSGGIVAAPNLPAVKAVTDGIKAALRAPSPFPAAATIPAK